MASKTGLLDAVKGFRFREVEAALAESPKLLRVRDARGRNWLHLCCGTNPAKRQLKPAHGIRTADVLLEAGLDLDREAFREGSWKATPLWFAIGRGENLALARHLLELGADPNHCLWAAAFNRDVKAIRLLARYGAEIDAVTEDETPFLGAIKWSHFEAAAALLQLGANVDFQDRHGRTALHYMLRKKSDEKHFRTLLRHGPRGDLEDRDGVTAAAAMARKRSPAMRRMAERLATG